MRWEIGLVFGLIFLLIIPNVDAPLLHNKFGPLLMKSLKDKEKFDVIITLWSNHSRNDAESVLKSMGALKRSYRSLPILSARVSKWELKILEKNPNIRIIEANRKFKVSLENSIPLIGADAVWNLGYNGANFTGAGNSICIIDTGVDYTHPDLGRCFGDGCKVLGGYDYVNDDSDPMDDNGHGTHVAGIAAANGSLKGVAPGANIVAVKALDSSGTGTEEDVVAAIDYCIEHRDEFNITAIVMSFGDESSEDNETYCDQFATGIAINTAVSNGIFVAVASGNNGYTSGISYPACASGAVSVGATDDSDNIASFTNRAEILDLLAPGVLINSTVPNGTCEECDPSGYNQLTGTSMSAPHVAGAAAVLAQAGKILHNITLTPDWMESLLKGNGILIHDPGTGFDFPRLDLYTAFRNLSLAIISVESPLNKSYSNGSLYFNITSDMALSSAFFSLNRTNSSMVNDSLYHYYNTSFPELPDGTYTVRFHANNTFGFLNWTDVTFTIDTVPPVITILSPHNISKTNLVIFNLSFNEPVDTVFISVDGEDNITLNKTGSNCTLTLNLTEGCHNFTIAVNDSAGNWNVTEGNLTVSVDPVVVPEVSKPRLIPNDTLNITVTLVEENPEYVWINVTQPNGSSEVFFMNNESGLWFHEYNATSVGLYTGCRGFHTENRDFLFRK